MKQLLLIFAFLYSGTYAYAAATARPTARASSATTQTNAATSGRTAQRASVSRAATTPTKTVSSRSAISQPATSASSSSVSRGRAATTTAARAASKQNVISTGTKVATATQNTVVDEVCWNKFSGCMDSFCMLDNANGGRCICSDKNSEYEEILAEIQELDNQSYQMATVGVERLEMGEDADAVMAKTDEVTKKITADSTKSKRQSLDLSSWNMINVDFDADTEDIFSLSSDGNSITNKTGDALYRASAKLCNEQIPECASQSTLMDLMYKQRVRSDCTAYENSLRQQRTQSAQKLATAQSAMREAALEQYRIANKYDLGQCTVAFKQCMQTTGGCGSDFTGCVTQQTTRDTLLSEKQNSSTKAPKQKKIQGASTTIEIAAWTYDALESKKPLCMNVTQQCVNVRDQVWDTFLREVAPAVKSAELMAESDLRTSCVSTIASCFQKACKDHIDPEDPDGSYDACLTHPDVFEDLCKVEIEPCTAINENIMEYVRARLASMRVDSCTREFKECLQFEDRCGEDYTQCVGLDTKTIVEMCPTDKLPGCKYEQTRNNTPETDVYKNLEDIATGIFLNIDNSMLNLCQKAVRNKVIEVCGDLSSCTAFDDDDSIGTESLIKYTDNNGNTVIDGLMNFGLLTGMSKVTTETKTETPDTKTTKTTTKITAEEYEIDDSNFDFDCTCNNPPCDPCQWQDVDVGTKNRIKAAVETVNNKVQQKLAVLFADQTIDMCVNGRSDNWRYNNTTNRDKFSRFPKLLDSYNLMIFESALNRADKNYRRKYDELVADALKNQSDDVKQMACKMMVSNSKDYLNCSNGSCEPSGALASLFTSSDEVFSKNGTRYTINNMDIKKKLALLSGENYPIVIKDSKGAMVSSVTMTSTFSPSSQICTITTTTQTCKNTEAIKVLTETDYVKDKKNEDGSTYYWCDDCSYSFEGTVCTEFLDPVITKTEIKL